MGLYLETWDRLELLVSRYPRSRYKKVRSEKEGVLFIKEYFCVKGFSWPKWIKEGTPHYPRLSQICRHLGMELLSSDDSEESLLDSDPSSDLNSHSPSTKPSKRIEGKKMGVDPSLRKDNELFGVGIQNVNVLEKGLVPSGLGKKIISLFL